MDHCRGKYIEDRERTEDRLEESRISLLRRKSWTTPHGKTRCMICRNGQRSSPRIWWQGKLQFRTSRSSGAGYPRTSTPKDRNCEVCTKATKKTNAICRKRTGNSIPRASKCGDLTTADPKILSEAESRNNHKYAVIVQDLATEWLQAFHAKQKRHKKLKSL